MKTIRKIHYLITSFPILYFIGLGILWLKTGFQKKVILFSGIDSIGKWMFDVCGYLFGVAFFSIIVSLLISFLLLFINRQRFSLRYIFSIIAINVIFLILLYYSLGLMELR